MGIGIPELLLLLFVAVVAGLVPVVAWFFLRKGARALGQELERGRRDVDATPKGPPTASRPNPGFVGRPPLRTLGLEGEVCYPGVTLRSGMDRGGAGRRTTRNGFKVAPRDFAPPRFCPRGGRPDRQGGAGAGRPGSGWPRAPRTDPRRPPRRVSWPVRQRDAQSECGT